jgi:serine/threonine protein kinase
VIGSTVGNHRILEKLGDGGMGTVYRAVDQMLDREVAIKVLRPELTSQPSLNERFRSEAIAMARVSHPNIAMLHGLERHGNDLFMVMEYVRGETLEHVVQRTGRIAWQRAAEILTSVLDALDHAHDMGVVHRDIKPANIMLTRTGAVKVMDFGIARMVGRSRQTQFGHAVGTPMYMAPEQLRGEDVDGRTDLYAVGAALFELVTGRMAFEADSDYKLMMMQLNDPPPAPSSLERAVPASIDRIVARAMAKRAEDRYPSAASFRAALQDAIRDHARQTPEPPRSAGSAVPATRFLDHAPAAAPTPPATVAKAAPDVAVTRMASSSAAPVTEEQIPTALGARTPAPSWIDRLPLGARERMRDWRTWAIAASLFVTAGMLALALKPSGEGSNRGASDPSAVAPNASANLAAAASIPPSETAAVGMVIPTSPPQRTVAEPPTVIDTTPIKSVVPERQRPQADKGSTKNRPVGEQRRTPVDSGSARTPPPAEPPKDSKVVAPPAAEPEESGESAAAAIGAALSAFASAASSSQVGAVDRVLRGPDGTRAQLLALVREGRLTFGTQNDGAPSIRGSEASQPFSARLTWRTPFGSNKRATVPMEAEFSRSGTSWHLSAVRILQAVELK